MDLAQKLQIRTGQTVYVGNPPEGFSLDLPDGATMAAGAQGVDAVLVFVRHSAELADHGGPFLDAAHRDAIAYIAYPKAGQLDTDLNRDILWGRLSAEGLRGVRQVSLDHVWSAMRFRTQ